MARSTKQHEARKAGDDEALRLALNRLAKQFGRHGYRNVAKLLMLEGWVVNHKKAERLSREEGLRLSQRYKKRKRRYHKDSSSIRLLQALGMRPPVQKPYFKMDHKLGTEYRG